MLSGSIHCLSLGVRADGVSIPTVVMSQTSRFLEVWSDEVLVLRWLHLLLSRKCIHCGYHNTHQTLTEYIHTLRKGRIHSPQALMNQFIVVADDQCWILQWEWLYCWCNRKWFSWICLIAMHKNSFSTSSWVWVALFPGSFPLSACGRKEPGKIGGFKLLTSGSSDRCLQSDCRTKSCGCVTL